ncbi:PAAR domain-containing protein [Aurantimonas sp. MSK8Z-1]|uniref:PAAR domain-containing protein n=1 Tax=Mangrovibrevibacter kandeliae TaxID=2968473 RepID=UPI0021188FEB|nr:PAAR domain-containing protein [Aurantimonas sp. MSK8Z-1]MCW4114743.1 PAAR domain-containing protein [Aurantimonas sp. MSK8Z-1]
MPTPAATLGDTASHPGAIISSCSRHYADNGRLIARLGDFFDCLIHGPNPIVGNASPRVEIEGAMAARSGSVCACGAVIIASAASPEV